MSRFLLYDAENFIDQMLASLAVGMTGLKDDEVKDAEVLGNVKSFVS